MKTIRRILGITAAIASFLLILVLFPALSPVSAGLAGLPFMKINPVYTGGDKAFEINKGGYILEVRKPVFEALIGTSKKGFVQIDWRGELPSIITDTIDFDRDLKRDFVIRIDIPHGHTEIQNLNPKTGDIGISTRTSYGWAVRVKLHR